MAEPGVARRTSEHFASEFGSGLSVAKLVELIKKGEVGDDDERRAEERVQKITDQHVKEIDELLKRKEAEIMEV